MKPSACLYGPFDFWTAVLIAVVAGFVGLMVAAVQDNLRQSGGGEVRTRGDEVVAALAWIVLAGLLFGGGYRLAFEKLCHSVL